jgi:hypothetical protein
MQIYSYSGRLRKESSKGWGVTEGTGDWRNRGELGTGYKEEVWRSLSMG